MFVTFDIFVNPLDSATIPPILPQTSILSVVIFALFTQLAIVDKSVLLFVFISKLLPVRASNSFAFTALNSEIIPAAFTPDLTSSPLFVQLLIVTLLYDVPRTSRRIVRTLLCS